jgi:hypothetical protein
MGSRWLHDLPQALASVPDVSYHPGWEYRSRSSGGFDNLLGIVCHHTATSASGSFDGYCKVAWTTHPSKPVANINLGRAGEIRVGVAGASNHAGVGGPRSMSKGTVPKDAGNRYLIGIEALNTGVGEPWPDVQQERYLALVTALCAHYGFNQTTDEVSHHEWTPGRKIDPAGPSRFGSINRSGTWDMNLFRGSLGGSTPPPTEPPPTEPPPTTTPPPTTGGTYTLELQKNDVTPAKREQLRGNGDVFLIQQIAQGHFKQLGDPAYDCGKPDGDYGPKTQGAVKRMQRDGGLAQDAWVGKQTWSYILNKSGG